MKSIAVKIKYLTVTLCLLLGPLLIIPYVGSEAQAPRAAGGVLDLLAWDFSAEATVPLNGEWEFYWGQLLTSADFSEDAGGQKPKLTGYVTVPHLWQGSVNGTEIQNQGVATYRIVVRVPRNQHSFGIKTEIIRVTSRLLVNGLALGGSGLPEAAKALGENAPENMPYAVYFTTNGDHAEIILQVANYAYVNGGIAVPVRFGTQEAIMALTRKINSFELVAFGFLFSGALYHIGVFLFGRRQERSLLYFGLFCLAFALVDISLGQKLLNQFVPDLSFVPMHKLRHVLTALATVSISLFLRQILHGTLPDRLTKGIASAFGAYTLAVILFPHGFINAVEKFFFPLSMGVYVLFILLLTRLLYRRQYGSLDRTGLKLLILGLWCLWTYFVVNVLYVLFLVINYRLLGDLALLLFLLFMSYMLAIQFANAYYQIEDMSIKLKEQDKAKDLFLTNTSHEFRTPLHGIIHMAQAVLEDSACKITPQQQENLSLVVSIAQRLSLMITDLLDFEKIKNNDLSLNFKSVEPCSAVDSVLDVFRHIHKGGQVKLVNRVPCGLPLVVADENRLRQVLYNVIGNALKFTASGEVAVTAVIQEDMLHFSVMDTGIGIPAENVEDIFRPFEQASTSRAEQYGGTGLGLAISRQLVERMKGRIWVKWSELGKGSEITFSLPLCTSRQANRSEPLPLAGPERMASLQPDSELVVRKGGEFTLLAVDDDPTNLLIIVNIFARSSYDILTAASGAEALQAVNEHKSIDIVLLDAMMPGMTGFEVCRRLRESYSLFELPVLLVTARSLAEDVAAGFAAGANDYVIKPFHADELRARVSTQLSLKKSVQDLIRSEVAFLQSQIKPHFFYNVLNTLVSLCYTDSRKAGTLLAEFSNYLRRSFDIQENRLFTSLENELSLVKSYVIIEQARFGNRLAVTYEIDPSLLSGSIPPLIIQPLVENAVRHGLMPKEEGGHISVTVRREASSMVIAVTDDGVGIPADKLAKLGANKQESASVGLRNMNRRLFKHYGEALHIASQEGRGTTVTLKLPATCPEIVQTRLP